MTNTFVKLANSFIRKYTPVTISYNCQFHRKSTLINTDTYTHSITNEFKGFSLLSKSSPIMVLASSAPYPDSSATSKTPTNLLSLIDKAVKQKDFFSNQEISQVEKLIAQINEVYEKREVFMSTYGLFVEDSKKCFLEDSHLTQLANTQKDLLEIEEKTKDINKTMKSLQQDFVNLIGIHYKETYAASTQSRNKPTVDEILSYHEVKNWNYLFPTINLTPKVCELYDKIKELKKEGKNLLDFVSNLNEQNAHKNLKGYVIYCESLPYYKEVDGFLNHDKRLTKSILSAKVFETSRQAELFAKRRGLNSSAIVEIDFVFAQVISSNASNMGPCMQSLMARRDSQNISEAIPELIAGPLSSTIKKNKI